MEYSAEMEPQRLGALLELGVLDSEPEPIFDSLTELALRTFDVPVAVISLVDKDRQWFKACIGLPVQETPRDVAFCDHTIRGGEALVVLDATADPRFAQNALVTGEPGIRFYAGAPLTTPGGYSIGTLCLIDFKARAAFGADEIARLRHIADAVMQGLVMRAQARTSVRKAAEAEEKAGLLSLCERVAKVGAWTWDPASNQTVWSPEVYRIHGFDPSGPSPDLAGVLAMYHPDDAVALAALVERAATLGEPYELRARARRVDGSFRDIITQAACSRDETGRVTLVYGSVQDVTELRLADAQLRQSEARYRLLADNAKDMILQSDRQGRVVYVSPAIRQLGYAPEDLIGLPRISLVHPDDAEVLSERLDAALRGEAVGSFELRMRGFDGEWIWLESNPAPARDENDRIVGVVSVVRNISERKAAEATLRESEARYRLLADNSTDLVLTYDLEGRVNYASPSLGLHGYAPADLIGRSFGGLTHPDDVTRVRQSLKDALDGEPSALDPFRARAMDGGWVWFEGRLSPLNDHSGRQVGVLGVSRDITARLAAEYALGEVNAELTRVARVSTLGAFSASIAHEINQPLAALVANSETALLWLSNDPPNLPMAQQAITRGVQNALRASETIARMRSLVTKGPSTVAAFDVNDAIREVLALTATELQRAKITAKMEVSPHPLMIHGDRIQVQQVLLNLIGNAVEAMRVAPEAERRLMIRSSLVEDGQVRIEIEDRGGGLDPHTMDHIFDNLFTTKTGGTGLGLSISKSIIESHGGRIWAGTAAPNGAVFRFQLPQSNRPPGLGCSDPRSR